VFLALGCRRRRSRLVRVLFGLVVVAWGLVVGIIGCFLLYAWLFTDHVVTHRNENIFLCAPWALALVVLAWACPSGRRARSSRRGLC